MFWLFRAWMITMIFPCIAKTDCQSTSLVQFSQIILNFYLLFFYNAPLILFCPGTAGVFYFPSLFC